MKNDSPWEGGLLERKTDAYSDEEYLKTFVAFANSVRPDEIATVLIGEDDDGNPLGVRNPDRFQIKIKKIIEKIYPAIVWHPELYEKDGHTCLRIEIKFSGDTPHFGGIAWIRKGSESKKASDEVFQKLIELRSGKMRELNKWLGKQVTIQIDFSTVPKSAPSALSGFVIPNPPRWSVEESVTLVEVNQFWISVKTQKGTLRAEPLKKLVLTFDHEDNQLKLLVRL